MNESFHNGLVFVVSMKWVPNSVFPDVGCFAMQNYTNSRCNGQILGCFRDVVL